MKNALIIKTLANTEGDKFFLEMLRTKCVRSNRYTEWKMPDKVEKILNINKHLFCVNKGKFAIFFNFINENFKNS